MKSATAVCPLQSKEFKILVTEMTSPRSECSVWNSNSQSRKVFQDIETTAKLSANEIPGVLRASKSRRTGKSLAERLYFGKRPKTFQKHLKRPKFANMVENV